MARTKRVRETSEYGAMVRRMIRAYGRRVADRDVAELAALVQLRQDLDEAVAVAVYGLRESGFSWGDIATALAVSRQAVHQRYGTGR